jgi:ADP-ribose pyrophosphatase YjhB (NUDIX family)
LTANSAERVTRIAAYALCVDQDRILLCHIAPGFWSDDGSWTLPGGGLDFGESPPDAALRELTEETGLIGEIESLAGVFSWAGRVPRPEDGAEVDHHGIQIVYRVRLVGGALRNEAAGSTDLAQWVSRAEAGSLPLVALAVEGVRLAFEPTEGA